jgi:hypothetical protein
MYSKDDLPKAISEVIQKDQDGYDNLILRLHSDAVNAKKTLLNSNFEIPVSFDNADDTISFVVDFLDIVPKLALFPEEKVFEKLKYYRFSREVFKWFTPIDEILAEINRLSEIQGLNFLKQGHLYAASSYIEVKVMVSIIESFGLHVKHNRNEESNILHKGFDNLYRKREYHMKKGQTAKQDFFERIMYTLLGSFESQINEMDPDYRGVKKLMLSSTLGDFSLSKELLAGFVAPDLSRNLVYLEMFPLIKLIYKDRVLYSQEEFDELTDLIYNGSYRKYKVSRVKKILN